jgi:hypothetical protein
MSSDNHDNLPVLSHRTGLVDLTKYFPSDKYNLVFPATTIQEISALHKVTFDVCQLSDDPDDGDVYEISEKDAQGNKKVSKFWQISAQGTKAIGFAANVQNIYPESGVKEREFDKKTGLLKFISYRAVLEVQRPDGSWKTGIGEKHLDFEALEKRGYKPRRLQVMRQFALEIIQSGAEARAIAQCLGMRRKVSKQDIKKPFVVPKVQVNLDLSKPLDRTLAIQAALGSRSMLYGRPIEPRSIPREIAAEIVDEENGLPGQEEPPETPAETRTQSEPGMEKEPRTEPSPEVKAEVQLKEWENASINERIARIDTLLKETGYKPKAGKPPNEMTPREQARYLIFLGKLAEEKRAQQGLPFEDGRKE